MFKELMAIVGMANETNKMVTGYQVEIDPQFRKRGPSEVPGLATALRDLLNFFGERGGNFDPLDISCHVHNFSSDCQSVGKHA